MSALMNLETYNPAAIAAATEISRKAPKKAGRKEHETHRANASLTHTGSVAITRSNPTVPSPASGSPIVVLLNPATGLPIVDGQLRGANHLGVAIDNPTRDAAEDAPNPTQITQHHEPHLTADTLPRYEPTESTTATIENIVTLHRERQKNIKAKTSLILQAKALVRSRLCTAADFEDDDTKTEALTAYGTQKRKLTKSAQAKVDAAIKSAIEDPTCEIGLMVAPYFSSIEVFDARQKTLEKSLVKMAKTLPAYQWAKSVKGLGDVSFATLVGECGDIGTYKSVAAVWKRLGLAVMDGKRQGAPGAGASAEDWIAHGYNKARRSVSWNARNGIVMGGPAGLYRPMFGEDVRANDSLTEYQKVFAERARYEMIKCPHKDGTAAPKCSDKGKESYSAHAVARAFRYTEKRMVKHLVLAWKRGDAK